MKKLTVVCIASLNFLLACNGTQQTTTESVVSKAAELAPNNAPEPSRWYVQGAEVNPIDGSKNQILSLDARESYRDHRICIVLSFHNGKLSRGTIGTRLDVDDFVTVDGSEVRMKFDNDKPIQEHWSGGDSHDTLFPYGRENQFLVNLLRHKELALEFSCYEKAPQTVTFNIQGLSGDLKAAGLYDPTSDVKHRR
ncbi:MAG: hypothetical protein ACHP8A_19395 [Terriglobales bacterium]|nr:hypothetical protein [Terriglobales bacterium]